MKIGVDISCVNNKITGTGRYINCLVSQLNNFEHEIKLIPNNKDAEGKNNFIEKLERLHYRHYKQSRDFTNANTDCAIFPNYFITPGYNKPAAVVIHDLSFLTHKQFYSYGFVKYYNYRLKETLKQNPVLLTVSNHTKKEIEKHLGVKRGNIFLVQGYSNFTSTSIHSENRDEKYFLYVGHIEPRKNLTFLVENFLLWNEFRRKKIKLKIAGELWIKNKKTKELLEKYGSNKKIELLGYVSEEQLKDLYKGASAFVHTSFVEGFGFPVLEAMHYNLPVLCSKGTAAEEISQPDSICINPNDPVDLILGLDKLLIKAKHRKNSNREIPFSPKLMNEQLFPVLDLLESKAQKKFYTQPFKAKSGEDAVIKTLLYANLFNAGIKKEELLKNAIDVKLSNRELNNVLTNLFNKNEIYLSGDSVFINSGSHNFYIKEKKNLSVKKIKTILNILNRLPFISAIAFSGGTANYGIDNHNDVDVFIITKPGTVLIVYLLIHLFSLLFRVRNELCANYLVDENNMEINNYRDLYTAHQIISLKTFKNDRYLNHFFSQNKWVKTFFPNFEFDEVGIMPSPKIYKSLNHANKIIKFFYRTFYKKKLTNSGSSSIILSDGIIKLHTNDHRIKVLKNYEEALTNYYSKKLIESKNHSVEYIEEILSKVG